MGRQTLALAGLLTAVLGALRPLHAEPAAAGSPAEVAALRGEIAGLHLEPAQAVAVGKLNLKLGPATLRISQGTLVPASPLAGRVVEMVFLGAASLELAAANPIEQGQLELFTGEPSLARPVTAAVLVIANDAPPAALFRRAVTTLDATAASRAQELYQHWKTGGARKYLNVDGALLLDALGDPLYQAYFAGSFVDDAGEDFLVVVEPDAFEQLTVGRFVPLDLSAKERRKAAKILHHEQNEGRLIGLAVDDLGQWDTWTSSALRDAGGEHPGVAAFEPERYVIDVALTGKELLLKGRARLQLRGQTGLTRGLRLKLHPDLRVEKVSDAGGTALGFQQAGREVLVVLPAVPAALTETVVEVEYSGDLVDKVKSGLFYLRDSIFWHPHAGQIDRATYDVTFHWPDRLELVTGGKRVDGGRDAQGGKWERRTSDLPTAGLGFEVGRFRFETRQAGHVTIRLGFPPVDLGDGKKGGPERLLKTLADTLAYYEEKFGPYPLDELGVALSPRLYSQSLPGFLTLSTLMMLDRDKLLMKLYGDQLAQLLLGLEDPRTVIAHEMAHQWWGHGVGWKSYRDQWLSEAMATYSAVLYARNRLDGVVGSISGPTAGWQDSLTAELADGRSIESLGPVVLGERLVSSRADDAYTAIVYTKGALVLEMLARSFGEKSFTLMLKTVHELVAHRAISTADFLTMLERQSGADLAPFARQYIYGTGLPEVFYDYSFEPQPAGGWKVKGTARQQSPYRYRYRVVRRDDGRFDVARERLDQISVAGSRLVVPVAVTFYDPSQQREDTSSKDREQAKALGNMTLHGQIWLDGETTQLDVSLEHEPKELFLDRKREVFGLFFNERRNPKRALLHAAYTAAARGEPEEAQQLCRRALATDMLAGPPTPETPQGERAKLQARLLDGRIQLLMARLQLDLGRSQEAAQALDKAESLLKPSTFAWWRPRFQVLEARLALHRGDAEKAFKALDKAVLRRGALDDAEADLLLAIAARLTGHREAEKEARERAGAKGADVSALDEVE